MIHTVEQQTGSGAGPLRPPRYWYLIAGGLLAAAVACLSIAVIAMFSWDRQVQDFQRVPVPGEGAVTLTQPGEYVLYVETRGQCCTWSVGSQNRPLTGWSLRLAVGLASGGPETRVSDWSGLPESYSVSGHQGLTGMSFTITRPGIYIIDTSDVHPGMVTDLAVGRNILPATLLPLVLIVAGLAALGGAVLSFALTAARRRRARRRVPPPGGIAPDWIPPPGGIAPDWIPPPGGLAPDSVPPARGGAPAAPAPVLVQFAGPRRQNRATVLFRAILAIPVLICLYFARYVAWLVLVTGWFGALFTGRLPDYAASFLAGFQRWEVGTYAYLLLLTDRYPFGSLDADYPVSVTLSPGRLNRAAVFFRMILIIPASLVAAVLMYGLGPILMIPTWLIVLIGGRMPQPLYQAIAASVRYWARMKAYWYLLTDVYPAGLFGDGPEPAPGGYGPPAPSRPPPGRSPRSQSRCRRSTRSCCRPPMWHRQRPRLLPGCRDGWSCPGRPSGSWVSPLASGPSLPWPCSRWSSPRPMWPRRPAPLRAAWLRRPAGVLARPAPPRPPQPARRQPVRRQPGLAAPSDG